VGAVSHLGSPGDGERVFVFDPSAISTYKTFAASNFDAEWVEDAKLAISSVGQVGEVRW